MVLFFMVKNSIHLKRLDVFSFGSFNATLVKFQICSFIVKNVDMVNRYISFKECKEQVGIGTVYKKKVYQELMDV